ncbi:hypothetical protein ABPG74_003417 [Tetrahymena malaccensis]
MELIQQYIPKKLQDLSMIIGLAYLGIKFLKFTGFLWQIQPLKLRNNLIRKYGQNSYALVTGSTDGIGKQLAISAAKRGFNLILISRNMDKLEATKQEINKLYSGLDIVLVQADFSKAFENGFFEAIAQKTNKYDISILVNNVGIDKFSPLKDIDDKVILDLIQINTYSQIMMTKIFAEKINSRPQKGGIIFTGSFSGFEPIKYFQVYGSTKALIKSFSLNVQNEYPNLDILHITPGEVSTTLIFNKKPSLSVATPQSCAEGSFEDLGRYFQTDGATRHKIFNSVLRLIPYSIFNFIFCNFTSKKMLKERQDGEQKYHKKHN